MALTSLGKVAAALWQENAPSDTSFMWMRIIDPANPDVVIPYRYRNGKWSQFSATDWLDSVLAIQSTPPGAPTSGQRYIVGAAATGAWAGQEGKIATKTGAGWDFYSPDFGNSVPVVGEQKIYSYYGSWLVSSGGATWGDIVGSIGDQADLQAALQQVYEDSKAYADLLVVGLWNDRGNYDASTNLFPASGGSGNLGSINKGDIWTISVGGTLGGEVVEPGDTVRAIVDLPGQTVGNWAIQQNNIGYVAENITNKVFDFSTINHVLYPTTQAVVENFYRKTGNAFGAASTLGLTDNFNLTIQTGNAELRFRVNGTDRVKINSSLWKSVGMQHLMANIDADVVTSGVRADIRGINGGSIIRLASDANAQALIVRNADGFFGFNGSIDGNFNYTFNAPNMGFKSTTGGNIYFADTDAGVDAKNWVIVANTSNFLIRTLNDAYNTLLTPISIARTGGLTHAVNTSSAGITSTTGFVNIGAVSGISSGTFFNVANTFSYSVASGSFMRISPRLNYASTDGGTGFELVSDSSNNTLGLLTGTGTVNLFKANVGQSSAVAYNGNYNFLSLTSPSGVNINISSGTFVIRNISINPTYNVTGGSGSFVIGYDYVPTFSGVVGLTHIAARFGSGRILIGSTGNPSARLHVRGEGVSTGELLRLEDNTPTNRVMILDNGTTTFNTTSFTIGDGTVSTSLIYASASGIRLSSRGIALNGEVPTAQAIHGLNSLTRSDGNQTLVASYGTHTITSGTRYVYSWTAGAVNPASGNAAIYNTRINSSVTPTGTTTGGVYGGLIIDSSFNFTVGLNTVVGLDYNPSFTGTTGLTHYAALFRSGLVGIGIAAPTTQLHVQHSGTIGFTLENSSSAQFAGVNFRVSATSIASIVVGGATSANPTTMIFRTTTSQGRLMFRTANDVIAGYVSENQRWSIGFGTESNAKFAIRGAGTGVGELFRLDDTTPTNRLLVLDNGSTTWNASLSGNNSVLYTHNGTLIASANSDSLTNVLLNPTFTIGAFTGVSRRILAVQDAGSDRFVVEPTGSRFRGNDSTSSNYVARFENLVGDLIARFRNDLVLELGGTSAILEVNSGIPSGNAAIRFLSNQALGYRLQDSALNDYLNFRSTTSDRAVVLRQQTEYDFGQGEKRITKQYTITTTTTAAAQNTIFEFTLADNDHYDIKVLHAEATATDGASITPLDFYAADCRKVASTNIEGNTLPASTTIGSNTSRLPSSVTTGGFNWNLDTTNQKIQFRFQNTTGTGKTFVIWVEISFVKRITPA